jgi:hypothetical protein
MFVIVLLVSLGCADNDSDTANISVDCTPSCPEQGDNSFYESNVPCGTEDGDEDTIEESCMEVEECDETIYCRAKGY